MGRQRADALSKGMAQKVQFISAVVARPKLLVLDEPFTGLDPVNMDVLKDAVLSLNRNGTTVIFSTHDMDIAERMCDTIFMIYRGRKVLDGTLSTIQSQYGRDTIRVRMGDGAAALEEPARRDPRERLRPLQGTADRPQADPQAILRICWSAGGSSISSSPSPRCTTSSCGSPGTGAGHRRRPPVNKILVIANREFRAIVGTKAFLIVITLMPILMFGGIVVQKMLEGRVGPTQKTIVVLDGTGALFDALAAAAEQHNENEIFDLSSGKQIKPRFMLLQARPARSTKKRRFQLSEQVRRRDIDAFLEIPAGIDQMPAENNLAGARPKSVSTPKTPR